MSLYRFGIKYTAPKDALINFLCNLCIPVYFLLSDRQLPLLGWGSVSMFLAPMFFCVFCFPLFFGVMNGVTARRQGWGGRPLAQNVPWIGRAFLVAFGSGTLACLSYLGFISLIHAQFPTFTVSPFALLTFQALSSALIGFWMQVAGVVLSGRLPEQVAIS